jgi:hypothetical protein
VQRLTDSRDKLNLHAEMMHVAHEPSGLTPFRLLGSLIRSRESSGEPDHSLEAPESWSPLDLETRRELVKEIAERIAADGAPHRHPWRGVGRDALDPSEMETLRKSLDSVAGYLTRMIAGAEFACALFELPRPKTFAETARLLGFVEASAAMPECDRQAFCDPVWDSVGDVIEVVEKGERFSKLRTAFDSAFVESAWNASLHECRTILAQKGRSLFRVFSSRYRAQVALLNSCLNVPLPKTVEQRLLLVDGLIAARADRSRIFKRLDARHSVLCGGRNAPIGRSWETS